MADQNQKPNMKPKNTDLENCSIEELKGKIEEDKKKLSRSTVLAFSALIAIIVLCIAWFVANNMVKAHSSSVAAASEVPFVLASAGNRQNAETEHFLNTDSTNRLADGETITYKNSGTIKSYYEYVYKNVSTSNTTTGNTNAGSTDAGNDSSGNLSTGGTNTDSTVAGNRSAVGTGTWESVNLSSDLNLYAGTGNLAWRLNGQEKFGPGASGKLEFYIIPKRDMKQNCTVTLDLKAYTSVGMTNSKIRATESTNANLQNLLSGHILLFQQLDDTSGYSGWISPENPSFTVPMPSEGFKKDVPYKVTIYWVWPKYLRNYVYNSRSLYGDLFTDTTTANADYEKIQKLVNGKSLSGEAAVNRMYCQKIVGSESTGGTGSGSTSGSGTGTDRNVSYGIENLFPNGNDSSNIINKGMTDTTLNTWGAYYDQADEYIGTNAQYVYINASVE